MITPILISIIGIIVNIIFIFGMINKSQWFFYPEKKSMTSFFHHNYELRKYFGNGFVCLFNIIGLIFIDLMILLSWKDYLS